MTNQPEHEPAAVAIISAELVACTLGRRDQPELRMDIVGVMARWAQGVARLFHDHDIAGLLARIHAATQESA